MTRRLLGLPPKLRGAAGPAPASDEDEDEDGPQSDMQLISIPADTNVTLSTCSFSTSFDASKYQDPLHILLEYIVTVGNLRVHRVDIFGYNMGPTAST